MPQLLQWTTVDETTGSTRYYEYGRYDDENCGLVRRQWIPDVRIGPEGRPTQESPEKGTEMRSVNV